MEQVAHFRILSRIGAGGMGTVYRARDEKLQRDVAVKVLPERDFSDATAKARLLREARAAAGLSHPNICVVHEIGEDDGQAYIAMECVEGEPLSQRIARGALTPQEVIRLGIQLADALAHAHAHGIVHRDLKPSNIILTADQRLKVLDFGLARRLVESADPGASTDVLVTAQGSILGTPAYMSPEQLRGLQADERSDIWAMGVILFEMAAQSRPFDGGTWPELSAAILAMPPRPLPPNVPYEIGLVIARCLEKEPGNRYRSAAEVRAALELLLSTVNLSRPITPPRLRARVRVVWGGAAVLAALLLAFLAIRVEWREASPPAVAAVPRMAPRAAAAAKVRGIAVLPFSSFSGSEEQYLAEGMQDAVISELARANKLRVLSRTSTSAFVKSGKTATEIGKVLDADNLVEGSLVRSGNRIRVQVKLIRLTPEENQVWAEAYERDMKDVLGLYGEIARAIALKVDAQLAAAIAPRRPRQVDPRVYELYLKGRFQLKSETKEGYTKAFAYFKQANEIDPADPLPYAGIAITYAMMAHSPLETADVVEVGRASVEKALALDPDQPDVYGAIAMLDQYGEWKWDEADRYFRRALELNPSDAAIRRHYAWFLTCHKKTEEALAQVRRAAADDPLTGIHYSDIAWILEIEGKYEEALPYAKRGVELTPDSGYNLYVLGIVQLKNRMFEEAIETNRRLLKVDQGFGTWGLAYALVVANRRAEAEPLVIAMREKKLGLGLAEIHAFEGNRDEAVRWLETDLARREAWMPWSGVFAEMAPLRGDPRHTEILKKVGVPYVEPDFGQPKTRGKQS